MVVDALSEEWARTPVGTRAWVQAFKASYGRHYETVELRQGPADRPDAAITLARQRVGVRRLVDPFLYEPGDVLYREPAAVEALAATVVATRLPVVLSRIPEQSPTVSALARAARGHGVLRCRPAEGWPGVELDGLHEEPERLLNAGRRSDLRRATRRARSRGELTVDVLSPTRAEVGRLFIEALEVEAASWKSRAGTALAVQPMARQFYGAFLTEAAAAGCSRVAFLRISGRAIAMQLAAVVDDRLFLLKIGYDEAWREASPGQLLMLEVVRHAGREGLRSVELLGSAEPWTHMWTRDVRPCVSLRYFPFRPTSVRAAAQDALNVVSRPHP